MEGIYEKKFEKKLKTVDRELKPFRHLPKAEWAEMGGRFVVQPVPAMQS